MTMDEQLKPCPFCGGEGFINIYYPKSIYYPQCKWCDLDLAPCTSKEEAVTAWNRRADGWIAVSERLPELTMKQHYVYVLAAFKESQVREMCYSANIYAKTERGREPRWQETSGKLAYSQPTHWQPLPAAPKAGDA
jgi:Lar family restriction alleviation protein